MGVNAHEHLPRADYQHKQDSGPKPVQLAPCWRQLDTATWSKVTEKSTPFGIMTGASMLKAAHSLQSANCHLDLFMHL